MGKDFWIAIPPNDPNNGGYWTIAVYIASAKDNKVHIENPAGISVASLSRTAQAGRNVVSIPVSGLPA